MNLLKIIALSIFVFVAYTISTGGSNSAANTAGLLALVGGIVLYISPWLVALKRDHPKQAAIGVLNLLAGWTVIGWVGAITWAYANEVKAAEDVVAPAQTSDPSSAQEQPLASAATATMKLCPFCAEEVRFEAIKCKHCHSDLSGAR